MTCSSLCTLNVRRFFRFQGIFIDQSLKSSPCRAKPTCRTFQAGNESTRSMCAISHELSGKKKRLELIRKNSTKINVRWDHALMKAPSDGPNDQITQTKLGERSRKISCTAASIALIMNNISQRLALICSSRNSISTRESFLTPWQGNYLNSRRSNYRIYYMCQVHGSECHSEARTQVVAEIHGRVGTLPFSSNASKELNVELAKFEQPA